jgi:hypothetical protein
MVHAGQKENFSGNSFQILCSGGIVGQKKVNARYLDFKNKRTQEPLWLKD